MTIQKLLEFLRSKDNLMILENKVVVDYPYKDSWSEYTVVEKIVYGSQYQLFIWPCDRSATTYSGWKVRVIYISFYHVSGESDIKVSSKVYDISDISIVNGQLATVDPITHF